jgi:NADPH-dependent curcumin reductase CurA
MMSIVSREIQLVSCPHGVPTVDNFTLVETKVAPIEDQQVLARNLYMSVDPYMRGRMNDSKSYVPPFELGKPLDGGEVGLASEVG